VCRSGGNTPALHVPPSLPSTVVISQTNVMPQ